MGDLSIAGTEIQKCQRRLKHRVALLELGGSVQHVGARRRRTLGTGNQFRLDGCVPAGNQEVGSDAGAVSAWFLFARDGWANRRPNYRLEGAWTMVELRQHLALEYRRRQRPNS